MNTPTVNERSLAIGGAIGKRAMLYLGILVFAFALLLLVSSSNASAADVYVSGSVSGTWSTGDNIYVVADANVDSGNNLTIQEGVNVYFDPGTSLTVNGQLIAISNDDNRLINFTSNAAVPAAGDWDGIYFNGAMTPSSVISGAHIEFAVSGVIATDSNVELSNIVIDDLSGAGVIVVRGFNVLPDLTITLDNLSLMNVTDGIIIEGLDRNLTVSITNCNIVSADNMGIFISATDAISTWNLTVTVDIENTDLSASAVNLYNAVDVESVGDVELDVADSSISDAGLAGVFALSLNGAVDVFLEESTIANIGVGIEMTANNGPASLDLLNVTISGPTLNQGIIVLAEEANAVVDLSGVTIEMNPNIVFGSSPAFDGINVMANWTVDFVAVDLTVIGGFDCVQLTSVNDDMSVDITGALMTDGPNDGLLMNSGGALGLSIVDSAFMIDVDISVISYWVTTTAIIGTADAVDAVLVNVDMQWLHGVSLVADQEIAVEMTDVSFGPTANDTFFVGSSGLYLASNEGNARVSLTDVECILDATFPVFYSSGNGIVVEANQTVVFNAVNLTVIGADFNGVSITSFNGAVEADISNADIEEIGDSGLLLYSEFDFVDLTLVDSTILGCGLDGVVAQAVMDVNLEFNNVVVNDTLDGVFALSTDGNVSADFTSISAKNSATGIRILAPNGWIQMVLDPSTIETVGTGIYLDAMGVVDLSVIDSFIGDAETGIEIHSFDGGINVLFDNAEVSFTDVYGMFADADNSNITVSSTNNTVMNEDWTGWYLITSNGSVSIDVDTTLFESGETAILVDSSNDLDANVVASDFLGQDVLGMNLSAGANITLNVENSVFDGQIAENAQLFYPTLGEEAYIIIQPEAGNWTTNQSLTATIPFDFDFNGATYNEVMMSLNGWLAFGDDGAPDASTVYPVFGPSVPNLIAPAQEIWSANDLAMDGYFHGMGYKYDGDLNAVIFQWFVWNVGQPQLANVFEVILYATGEIEFRYAMMDGFNLTDNSFGINMFDGPSWDLGILGSNALDMDFQSVFFTTEMLSDGSAIFATAGENMVATIDISSFSHYLNGGVLLVAENGSASIELQGSEFSFIYAIDGPMGAFVALAPDNFMTAGVFSNSFDTIATAAIVLFDAPDLGGIDSFDVEGNHFNQVIITTAIVSMISDEEQAEPASYVSTKIFTHNDGTHVGLMAIATIVNANVIAWNVLESDIIENNNFTGDINPWMLNSLGILTVPYLGAIEVELHIGMMNVVFALNSDVGDNQVTHHVSVAGNKLNDGPVRQFFELGQPEIGAVTIVEMVTLADDANLVKQTDINVADNVVAADNASFASGIEVAVGESLATPVDGMLSSNLLVTCNNNSMNNWYGNGVGFGLAAMQQMNDGKGQGFLIVDVAATGNTINGFHEGIFIAVDTEASNLFGDVISYVNALVRDNEIGTYDGITIDLETSVAFEHYFPPYEQVVDSNATMAIDVEIINNTVDSYNDAISVVTAADAVEDEFGVFTNANASITGPVNVLDNVIYVYWDSFGVSIRSEVSAAVSMATAMSDVPVTIANNEISAYWLGGAIFVSNAATASTLALRFEDEPFALMVTTLDVNGNTINSNSGILIRQNSEAIGGVSHAVVSTEIMVTNNTITGISYNGIQVDVSADSDPIDSYPWAEVNVDIAITGNNLSGYAGTGINVTVLPDEDLDVGWVDISGSILIENNTVSGLGVSIFVSAIVPAEILNNTLTGVGGGSINIEDSYSVTIQGNMISNVSGDGIKMLRVSDVLIKENTFTNIGESGVEVDNVNWLWVLNNTMTNVSYYGVEVNDATNVFIENNTMSMMFGGVDLYNVNTANIMNNIMSAGAVAPVEEEPGLAQVFDEGYGVDVDNSDHIMVTGNEISGFEAGVELDDVSDLVFTWNVVTGSVGDGAYFFVEGAVIANNTFNDNGITGVIIEDSFMVTFANNEVRSNGLFGLLVIETDALTLVNGVFADNDIMGFELDNTSVDWNINAESSVLRNDVLFSGDLTVMAGGSLMLDTVDFGIIPDMRDGLSSINVMANGSMSAIDTDFYAVSFDIDGFGVTYGDYYEFNVYGTLEFINVYESDALELYLGAGSVVTIETSTITNNLRNGIHIVDSSPLIMSCSIVSNPRNGIFIEGGAAAPRITDCIIADNDRGIYALNTKLETVTDNLIVLNSEAGLFADNVSGSIRDNTFLLNHKEIYVRNSNVSIQDNQIGYTPLVQLLAQFVPLLQGFNLSDDIFLPELGLSFNAISVQNVIIGHVGIYAVDSVVRTSGNSFGMLSTAVQVVNSDLTFGDDIRQNTIIVPYMDNGGIIRNMSLPIPVWDGIVATNSHVVIRGASIDVLDDAVFLDNSTASISSSTLSGADFNLYLINGSNATVSDSTFGKAKAEDRSAFSVWEKLTIVVKDPWGATLANVPVRAGSVETTTDSNGMAVVLVEAYVMTSSGKVPASPSAVSANFTNVPTTSYPGHASWVAPVVSEQVSLNGPTTVVLVSGVTVRFDLTVHVLDKDGKNAVNVTVVLHDAANNPVAQAQTDANGTATFVPISYVKNADGTTDNHLTPYKVSAAVGKDTAQGTTNLTGNTNLDIKVDLGPQFDYGPAIIIGVLVAIMFVATLIAVRRRP